MRNYSGHGTTRTATFLRIVFTCFLMAATLQFSMRCLAQSNPDRATSESDAPADLPTPAQQALDAFRLGSEAAAEERWADSARHFEEAYNLTGSPSASFNRGVALRAMGRHVEARDAFDEALRADPPLDDASREIAQQLRDQSSDRISTLTLVGLDPDTVHEITLDGADLQDDSSRPFSSEVNEGLHSLVVQRPGWEPFAWNGDVMAGASISIDVELMERAKQRSLAKEPWFWVLTSALTVGAVVGTVLIVRRTQDSNPVQFPSGLEVIEYNP
ncbi:MAG: tetratricopeptide repeat protein [Myxococcota bacterium]